jgi:hypothetical protein
VAFSFDAVAVPFDDDVYCLWPVELPLTPKTMSFSLPLAFTSDNLNLTDLHATGSVIVQAVVADVLTSLIIVAPPPGAMNFTPAGQAPDAFGPCKFQFVVST